MRYKILFMQKVITIKENVEIIIYGSIVVFMTNKKLIYQEYDCEVRYF